MTRPTSARPVQKPTGALDVYKRQGQTGSEHGSVPTVGGQALLLEWRPFRLALYPVGVPAGVAKIQHQKWLTIGKTGCII